MNLLLAIGLCLNFTAPLDEKKDAGGEAKSVAVVFVEELRIGPESGEEHHVWTGANVTVDIDSRGHMFVTDTGGNRILEFDDKGGFVRQLGGKGEGPGQFQFLKSFRILENGKALAFEQKGPMAVFNHYDQAIEFVDRDQKQLPRIMQSAVFSPDGSFVSSFYMTFSQSGAMTYTGVLNKDYEPVIELSKRPAPRIDPTQVENPGFWTDFYAEWFRLCAEGLGISAFDNKGNIYTARTNIYEITRWDADLKKTAVIKREYKPIIQTPEDLIAFSDPIRGEILSSLPASLHQYITPKVVESAIEKAEFPPGKQPIFGMVPMEDGGLLVVHDFNPITGKTIADIFDADGKYLGQSPLPRVSVNIFGSFFGNPVKLILKNGRAYAIEINQDGEQSLVRYAYQVKKS